MQDDVSDILQFLLQYLKMIEIGSKSLFLGSVYSPIFCQMKDLIKIYILGKFWQEVVFQ